MKSEVIHSKSDDQGQIFAMDLRDMMKDALRLQVVCQAWMIVKRNLRKMGSDWIKCKSRVFIC